MSISVIGAGAFGTSLAIALSLDGTKVTLWGRNPCHISAMQSERTSGAHLPGFELPDSLTVVGDLSQLSRQVCLLAVPMQALSGVLEELPLDTQSIVACCKGIDRTTGLGPTATIEEACPDSVASVLTGPSFAVDIAAGLPTALVLACKNEKHGAAVQSELTRPALRLYRTTDIVGAELGGALKNVIALAAGMAIGAGLGDSARASVIARGFGEMVRYAASFGAAPATLNGLSGLGDLVLTCTSEKSRNFGAGVALGKGDAPKPQTIEGMATSVAVAVEAKRRGLDLPLMSSVARVVSGELDISDAITTLLSRPVGKE